MGTAERESAYLPLVVAHRCGRIEVTTLAMGADATASACSGAGAKQPPELLRFPVLDVADVVALEQAIAGAGTPLLTLMERAGGALARFVEDAFPASSKVAVLCGSGNNGGDGWVAAHLLAARGFRVTVHAVRRPADLRAEPARTAAHAANLAQAAQAATSRRSSAGDGGDGRDAANAGDGAGADGATESGFAGAANAGNTGAGAASTDGAGEDGTGGAGAGGPIHLFADAGGTFGISESDVILDCLLGTGFDGGAVKEPYRSLIGQANEAHAFRLACDVPSGMSAQTGAAHDVCVHADVTMTMLAVKTGLVAAAAEPHIGRLLLAPLGQDAPGRI